MDRQPTLVGSALRLRPLAPQDRDALYAVASDPALWALHPAQDRWQRPVFDAMFDDAMAQGGALLVMDRTSEEVIGSSQYRPSTAVPGAMEIGWTFLARDRWGGAANRELKRLMLTHLFEAVDQAVFRIWADNHRSRRAMEKIGGRQLPQVEAVAMPDGRVITHVLYGIDRAGFAAGPLLNA